MAANETVARRYATALLALAEEAGAIGPISDNLEAIGALLAGADGRNLRSALFNPAFTHDERRGVLDAILARLGAHPLTANTLRLMNRKGRLWAVPSLVLAWRELADERAGRVTVHVSTAAPLTPALLADVQAALAKATGKAVRVELTTDPRLLGGLVAQVGGKVFDASLRNRLEQIRDNLLNATDPAVA